jgi:hypothetical protein
MMYYYVCSVQATIDGIKFKKETLSFSSRTHKYRPSLVRKNIEGHFRKKNPTAKNVSVIVFNKHSITSQEYLEEEKIDLLNV